MIVKAVYRKNSHAKGIVIFIHGIVESPAPFAEQMDIAYNCSMSVASMILPGHGGTTMDFARSSGKEWLEYAQNKIANYRQEYDKIFLFGHSMGSLLSILSYVNDPRNIEGIIAFDTPLFVSVKPRAVRNILKTGLCKNVPESDPAYHLQKYMGVEQGPTLSYALWLPRIADLFTLMRQTRSALNEVKTPLLVFHADNDELVASSSVRYFEKHANPNYLQLTHLTESSHFHLSDSDRKKLNSQLNAFLSKIKL